MSSRTQSLLRKIPGFEETYPSESSREEFDEEYLDEEDEITQEFIDKLNSMGVQINDVIVTEDETTGLQTPYIRMEDERNSQFYVIVDMEVEGISTKPGTPIYTVSSSPASTPFSMKTMSLSSRSGSVQGSVIECDADGLCFLMEEEGEPSESYLRKKSADFDEEKPKSIATVVSLKSLMDDPKTVLNDIKKTNKTIHINMKKSCTDKISRNKVALKNLQEAFTGLTSAIQTRFSTLEKSTETLEEKIEYFNKNPNEIYRANYQLAAKELDLRREQYDQVVGYCESTLNELFVLFNNLDKQIRESVKWLNYENETYKRIYSKTQ